MGNERFSCSPVTHHCCPFTVMHVLGFTRGCSGLPLRNMVFLHKQYTGIAFQGIPGWHMGHLAIASSSIAKVVMLKMEMSSLAIGR